MKNSKLIVLAVATVAALLLLRSSAQDRSTGTFEYATIRWSGKENTHLIRPGGKVEFIGSELRKMAKPDKAGERAFYMNAAMNGLAKESYEFAGMTSDEIVMKRAISR